MLRRCVLLYGDRGCVPAVAGPRRAFCSPHSLRGKSPRVGKGHWNSFENRKRFIVELGKRLGVEKNEDWTRVTVQRVRNEGGSGVLRYYNYSLGRALEDLLDGEGDKSCGERDRAIGGRGRGMATMRRRAPRGHWDEIENRREFLLGIAEKLNIDTTQREAWKVLTVKMIEQHGGKALLNKFNGSMLRLLSETFPEEEWSAEDCRAMLPNRFWHSMDNRRKFLDGIAKEFDVTEPKEWSVITNSVIAERGGSGLLGHFSGSLFEALRATYPQEEWREEECRPTLSAKYWDKVENSKRLLDSVMSKFSVKEPSDWRRVSDQDVIDMGGLGMIRAHKGLWNVLKFCYGEEESFFSDPRNEILARGRVRSEQWEDVGNVRLFLETAKRSLQIESSDEWQRVSKEQISSIGGTGLLKRYGLLGALRLVYPEENWEKWEKGSQAGKKASQRQLFLQVRSLAPNAHILEDYLHPGLSPDRSDANAQ